jgi:hypothetical protein
MVTTKGPRENAIWVDFVEEQLAVEEARKSSLESRGVAAITASGALATILLGFVTLTKKSGEGVLVVPGHARGSLDGHSFCSSPRRSSQR